MKKKIFIFLFILASIFSCAQVTSLNLKKHQFGKIPTKIIWMQVAGLTAEQIALLKYSYPSRSQLTPFEKSLCVGHAWEYNLYDIRPTAQASFLSQLSGKKNIKETCGDYEQKPIWKYVSSKGYKIGIFEGESKPKQSLLAALDCPDGSNYLKETTFWSMNQTQNQLAQYFHVSEKNNFKANEIYYDKSCKSGDCFTTYSQNIEGVFSNFTKNSKNYIFIVRNFKYQDYLRKKLVKQSREELEQIGRTLAYFQDLADKSSDVLVILTSAESVEIDFPKAGAEWDKYEKQKVRLNTKNSKLLSPIWASGARAENFCGMYDQSQILARIFSGAKQQGLEFSIINPFE